MNPINLKKYSTPWLKVMQEIFKEYGPEQINHLSQTDLRLYIKQHVMKNDSPICDSDIYYIAKFIRNHKKTNY